MKAKTTVLLVALSAVPLSFSSSAFACGIILDNARVVATAENSESYLVTVKFPSSPDAFQVGQQTLRFSRDRQTAILEFNLESGTRGPWRLPVNRVTLNDTRAKELSLRVGDVLRVSVPRYHIQILRRAHTANGYPPLDDGDDEDTGEMPESSDEPPSGQTDNALDRERVVAESKRLWHGNRITPEQPFPARVIGVIPSWVGYALLLEEIADQGPRYCVAYLWKTQNLEYTIVTGKDAFKEVHDATKATYLTPGIEVDQFSWSIGVDTMGRRFGEQDFVSQWYPKWTKRAEVSADGMAEGRRY